MSEDGVYPSSVPSFHNGMWSSKRSRADPILTVKMTSCSIGVFRSEVTSGPKMVYRNSESYPKFEVKMS